MLSLIDQLVAIIALYLCELTIFIPGVLKKILSEELIAFLNLFGCSIFIAVALMHLSPEADEC